MKGVAELRDDGLPGESGFTLWGNVPPGLMTDTVDPAFVWGLRVDPVVMYELAIRSAAPVALLRTGMELDQARAWVGFLRVAVPEITAHVGDDGAVSLVGDYGGADALVVRFRRGDVGWVPEEFGWWRRRAMAQ